MRRKDREVLEVQSKLEIIKKCEVLRIALCNQNIPYIVPMNFGEVYEDDRLTIFLHCASQGKKIDMIMNNPNVCFEMECNTSLVVKEKPQDCTYKYESIIGNGIVKIVEDDIEKKLGLDTIMKKINFKMPLEYTKGSFSSVKVLKIEVNEFTGKKNL